MNHRTRIKICGLTRIEDVQDAVAAGADALGFVFYPKSPRYVTPRAAAELISVVPPFVTTVGLFVNAAQQEVIDVAEQTSFSMLQFHGDETPEQCAAAAESINRPFMRAMRIKQETTGSDLLECERYYRAVSRLFSGLLLDSHVEGYGGAGKVFDWSLIPEELGLRAVLSGGLSALSVADAIAQVHPYAVDVSSGVEQSKGVKDAAKIRAFIETVRAADQRAGQ